LLKSALHLIINPKNNKGKTNMRRNRKSTWVITIIITVLALCALAAGMAAAQEGAARPGMRGAPQSPAAPQGNAARITFQGRLTSADGSPVNAPVQVTFRIYTDVDPAVAPTAIWTSAERTITPVNGLFTVYLGDGDDPSLTDSIASSAAAISIQVAPDPEMTPRQPLNTVVGYGAYAGTYGGSTGGYGVYGSSTTSTGVYGHSASGTGVYGYSGTSTAGYFNGAAPCCDSAGVRVKNYNNGVGLWASTTGSNSPSGFSKPATSSPCQQCRLMGIWASRASAVSVSTPCLSYRSLASRYAS
jgi:hypothetical protein